MKVFISPSLDSKKNIYLTSRAHLIPFDESIEAVLLFDEYLLGG
jgi:hypothetical protein